MRPFLWFAGAAIGLALVASEARAQGPRAPVGPVSPPGYSPYLNLLRSGSNPAISYYGLVRPQQAFAQSLQGLQGQFLSLPTLADQQSADGVLTTGHTVFFMNYGNYFMNTGAGVSRSTVATPVRTIGGSPTAPPRTANRR